MKKLLLGVVCLCLLCGCAQTPKEKTEAVTEAAKETPIFVEIEHSLNWVIVYHKDTKVMYAVSNSHYNSGTFTLLVNAYGNPMLYEGGEG